MLHKEIDAGAQGKQVDCYTRKGQLINAQGQVDINKIVAQGGQDRQNITTQEDSQGKREQTNIRTEGDETRETIASQSTADITKIQAQNQADMGSH